MLPWALLAPVLAPILAMPQATRPAPAALPAWWRALAALPGLEARFSQSSQSDVFGRMVRKGSLRTARGGRLRVSYDTGLLLVSDGRTLVHYDPEARTAQRLDLQAALLDMPLLNLLVDPAALPDAYQLVPAGVEAVLLKPRRPGLPEVRVEGRGQAPTRLAWKDGTGAEQELRLEGAKPSSAAPPATFQFTAPKGTRWLK